MYNDMDNDIVSTIVGIIFMVVVIFIFVFYQEEKKVLELICKMKQKIM